MVCPIAICGATATGKTSLAIRLAGEFGGEIIGCDSMQIYRGMDIGTAKPTASELDAVPHHMIDILEPTEPYSAMQYKESAEAAMEDIISRGRTPILCGGTGLYLDAVVYDNKYSDGGDGTDTVRAELMRYAEEHGKDALYERLREIDPESADAIHPNNVRRVARAIEIYELTGRRKSEWDAESRPRGRRRITVIGLRFSDRELHREAIRRRCREMIEAGIVDEARRLYESGALDSGMPASQAIGYKEFLPYLAGEETLDEAEMRLFYATCRYAKRQATWFYKKDYISWLEVDGVYTKSESAEALCRRAAELCRKRSHTED